MPAWCSKITSEVLRYICIVIPVGLAVWQYAEFTEKLEELGLAVTIGATAGAIVLWTFFVYLPLSMCRYKFMQQARNWGWRPSIVVYIAFCGIPCMVLLAYALTSDNEDPNRGIDPESLLAIQTIVLGLTFTEWAAKVSEEDFNTDMLTAVAADLFYSYDVYEFFDVTLHEDKTVVSDTWVWVAFGVGILSMCKYIPHMPITCSSPKACPKKARRAILTAMFCQEFPFLFIRLFTIGKHGPTADDFFFPFKNLALLIIHSMQLCKLREFI